MAQTQVQYQNLNTNLLDPQASQNIPEPLIQKYQHIFGNERVMQALKSRDTSVLDRMLFDHMNASASGQQQSPMTSSNTETLKEIELIRSYLLQQQEAQAPVPQSPSPQDLLSGNFGGNNGSATPTTTNTSPTQQEGSSIAQLDLQALAPGVPVAEPEVHQISNTPGAISATDREIINEINKATDWATLEPYLVDQEGKARYQNKEAVNAEGISWDVFKAARARAIKIKARPLNSVSDTGLASSTPAGSYSWERTSNPATSKPEISSSGTTKSDNVAVYLVEPSKNRQQKLDKKLGKPVKMLVYKTPNGKTNRIPIRSDSDIAPAVERVRREYQKKGQMANLVRVNEDTWRGVDFEVVGLKASNTVLNESAALSKTTYADETTSASVAVGEVGVKASTSKKLSLSEAVMAVNASVGASLLKISVRKEFPTPEFQVLGEGMQGKAYVFFDLDIGASISATIEGKIKRAGTREEQDQIVSELSQDIKKQSKSKKRKVQKGAEDAAKSGNILNPQRLNDKLGANSDGSMKPEIGASAGIDAFAGVRAIIGAGIQGHWIRKDKSAYAKEAAEGAAALLGFIASGINPGLGWLLQKMDVSVWLEPLMDMMDWKAGSINLVTLEGALEGSAGVGFTAKAGISFSGGKISFTAKASITKGLGAGGKIRVGFDALEGVKLALVAFDEVQKEAAKLRDALIQWVGARIEQILKKGNAMNSFLNWVSSDSNAHEIVQKGAHTYLPVQVQAQMIDDMCSLWTDGDHARSAYKIIADANAMGRASELNAELQNLGWSGTDIYNDISGSLQASQRTQLRTMVAA